MHPILSQAFPKIRWTENIDFHGTQELWGICNQPEHPLHDVILIRLKTVTFGTEPHWYWYHPAIPPEASGLPKDPHDWPQALTQLAHSIQTDLLGEAQKLNLITDR